MMRTRTRSSRKRLEAYEILSDAEKRQAYDQYGHAGVDPQMGGGGFQGGSFSDIFGDVFGDIFGGGGGRRQGPQRGSDLRYTLEVSLEDAVRGKTAEIKVPSLQHCDTCDGTGAKPGTSVKTCGTCGGSGQVRMQQGFFQVQQTCPTCRGKGTVIESPCSVCHGEGLVEKTKTLSVKVPPGVDTGDRIRLSGEGEAGPQGGPNGDSVCSDFREAASLCSSVMVETFTASSPSVLPTLHWVASTRFPRWTVV